MHMPHSSKPQKFSTLISSRGSELILGHLLENPVTLVWVHPLLDSQLSDVCSFEACLELWVLGWRQKWRREAVGSVDSRAIRS